VGGNNESLSVRETGDKGLLSMSRLYLISLPIVSFDARFEWYLRGREEEDTEDTAKEGIWGENGTSLSQTRRTGSLVVRVYMSSDDFSGHWL